MALILTMKPGGGTELVPVLWQAQNDILPGLHPVKWAPQQARGAPGDVKWRAIVESKPRARIFRLVEARELTEAQKWDDICAALGLNHPQHRNVSDILGALARS